MVEISRSEGILALSQRPLQSARLGLGIVYLSCLLLLWLAPVVAQGRTRRLVTGQPGASTGSSAASTLGSVYPQFRSPAGVVHWINEQMPLKVYVSHGSAIDEIVDDQTGAPVANVNNLGSWPRVVANLLESPGKLSALPMAQGFTPEQYQAAVQGISEWKPFERERLFAYSFTDDPTDADIFVFWCHHFKDKLGMALFAGDIRGYTSKDVFPYRAVVAGLRADFKPVVIVLRTTDNNGNSLPFYKMMASAAHEFGHALGIDQHSTNPADLMSVYYGTGRISVNDAATIRYLYHLIPDAIP